MSVYSLSLSFLWSIFSKKYIELIWTWKVLFHNTTCIKGNFHQKSFIYLHVFHNNCKSNRFYITDSNSFKITDNRKGSNKKWLCHCMFISYQIWLAIMITTNNVLMYTVYCLDDFIYCWTCTGLSSPPQHGVYLNKKNIKNWFEN